MRTAGRSLKELAGCACSHEKAMSSMFLCHLQKIGSLIAAAGSFITARRASSGLVGTEMPAMRP